MNQLDQALHYPLGDFAPQPGRACVVAPGVKWLRLALPSALNHINLWLLRDEVQGQAGWTVVDCGLHNEASQRGWLEIFAHELEGLPVLRVLVTHLHPDHLGLADWLCERWQAPLWMSATDYQTARLLSLGDSQVGGDLAADFFARHGLSDAEPLAHIRGKLAAFKTQVPAVPERFNRLLEGDVLRIGQHAWRCISGYGHAPEHIALFCPDLQLLIAGDMLLPSISSNVSVYAPEPESNPLKLFLASIDKFLTLPAATLVLPSHGRPFVGAQRRVRELHAHHQAQLAKVSLACAARACSAADLLPLLFKRQLDSFQMVFAMGEAIAHLHWLWFDGQLERQVDAQGHYRFAAASGALRPVQVQDASASRM